MPEHLTVNIILDLKGLIEVDNYSKKNQPTLLRTAARRYVTYLRERFLALSAGGGEWPELEESTIERKERRGWAEDPYAILRESDTLFNSIGHRTRGKYVYVGYNRQEGHPRAPSVTFLARLHSDGGRFMPARVPVKPPDASTRRRMADDIIKEYNKLIRKNRGK